MPCWSIVLTRYSNRISSSYQFWKRFFFFDGPPPLEKGKGRRHKQGRTRPRSTCIVRPPLIPMLSPTPTATTTKIRKIKKNRYKSEQKKKSQDSFHKKKMEMMNWRDILGIYVLQWKRRYYLNTAASWTLYKKRKIVRKKVQKASYPQNGYREFYRESSTYLFHKRSIFLERRRVGKQKC